MAKLWGAVSGSVDKFNGDQLVISGRSLFRHLLQSTLTRQWAIQKWADALYMECLSIKLNGFFIFPFSLFKIIREAVSPMALKSVEMTVMPKSSFKGVSLYDITPISTPRTNSLSLIWLMRFTRSFSSMVMKRSPFYKTISSNISSIFSKEILCSSQNFLKPCNILLG